MVPKHAHSDNYSFTKKNQLSFLILTGFVNSISIKHWVLSPILKVVVGGGGVVHLLICLIRNWCRLLKTKGFSQMEKGFLFGLKKYICVETLR